MKYLFCFIFIFYALLLRGGTTPTLVWAENYESLVDHIRIYENKNDAKSIAEILHDSVSKNWEIYPSDYLQLGYKNSYIWLRLDIDFDKIPSEKLYWWFDISMPQDVQFYQIDNDSIQKYVHTGSNFPFIQRDVLNRHLIFSFQPKLGAKTILLARFHSDVGSMVGYSYLHSASDFSEIDRKNLAWWLAVFVFMFIAALLSFGLWLAFKEKIYAYYGAYLLCAMMLLISINGFGYEWFWRNSPLLANATKVVWTFGMVGFLLVFVYRLLFEAVKTHIIIKRSIQIITGLLAFLTLVALNYNCFPPTILPLLLYLGNFTILTAFVFTFIILGIGIYKKYHPAYYFLWAILPVALTGVLMIFRNAGLIHANLLQSSFIAIPAFCIEIVLLFLALLKRFQVLLKNQQEKLQMELDSQIRLQNERERISRDLHDNVGAQLSYIISNIDHILETQNMPKNRLNDVADTAKNAILNLRETIWAINNEQITVEDFYDRFKLYARNQVKNRSDIQMIFGENIAHNHLFNPNQALNLYRICQEALNNTLKHAHATTIDIFIHANESPYFQFSMSDNGVGFDFDAPDTEGGYGLKNMKARSQEIGAEFNIFSEKGKGTRIELRIFNYELRKRDVTHNS